MAERSTQNQANGDGTLSSTERELAWTLLDKRPEQSEIISYDSDEIAEVRRLTETELKLISRYSATGSALNKETQSFLDAASIVRALSHVAENRFEQGLNDAAAKTVINAIRWQRLADGLFLTGGVTLPRINPIRLWYLLAEIYLTVNERELALKTIQKSAASIGEFGNPPLAELLSEATAENRPKPESPENAPSGYRRFTSRLAPLRTGKALAIYGVLIIGLLLFAAFRAQVSAKSMIDNSSEGIDYLNIAFGPTGERQREETLILASNEFAILRGKLDSWSWLITLSSVVPPVHDQFVAMDRLADLGSRIVAAPLVAEGAERLRELGSPENVCASAERLSTFNGNLLDQLEKNRTQMLESVSPATQGACVPG